jgi:hypothetical protein
MDQLFSANAPSDPTYIAIRDEERFADLRLYLNTLWERCSAYADPCLRAEIGRQFHQRYWEMRLGCTLLDLDFVLKPEVL